MYAVKLTSVNIQSSKEGETLYSCNPYPLPYRVHYLEPICMPLPHPFLPKRVLECAVAVSYPLASIHVLYHPTGASFRVTPRLIKTQKASCRRLSVMGGYYICATWWLYESEPTSCVDLKGSF